VRLIHLQRDLSSIDEESVRDWSNFQNTRMHRASQMCGSDQLPNLFQRRTRGYSRLDDEVLECRLDSFLFSLTSPVPIPSNTRFKGVELKPT